MKYLTGIRLQVSEMYQVSGNRQLVCQMSSVAFLSNATCSLLNANDRREIA